MPHSKKKAGILTTASSLVVLGVLAISSGSIIEGFILIGLSGGLFGLYEFFQVKELPVPDEDLEKYAEQAADEANEFLEDRNTDD